MLALLKESSYELGIKYKTAHSMHRDTYKNALTFTIFLYLTPGNLFLSLFAYLFVSMLCKISNDYLQYLPRNLLSFDISLEVRENFENLIEILYALLTP